MPTFKYKGRSDRGELIVGIIEAGSADAVATQLSASGVTPIDIAQSTQGADLVAPSSALETSRSWSIS